MKLSPTMRNDMKVHGRLLVLLMLTAAGCAGGGAFMTVRQGDYRKPETREILEEAERAMLHDAFIHMQIGDNARDSGNLDQARQEDKVAAGQLAGFADKFPSSEWRIVARRISAQRYRDAGDYLSAATQAEKMYRDPMASDATKAMAARMLSSAWFQEATNQAKEGKVDRLKILVSSQRGGQPLKPRVPAEPWKRFVEWADAFAKVAKSDPVASVSGDATPASQIVLRAADVEYCHDNAEDARARFASVIETWPSDAEAMEGAVPLYLDTFLLKGDDDGYDAALARIQPIVAAESAKAAEAAKAPGAGEEKKKAAETFARLDDSLAKQKESVGFSVASRLFQAGKNAEAAQAFEKFAGGHSAHPDAPAALYNAAIAWDRAKDPKKAEVLRDKLLKAYPDAKVVPQTVLAQAVAISRRGDHAGAQKLYAQYLEKWPQADQRCIALQNIGVEANGAGNRAEAARRFRAFAGDEKCAKEDPNGTAHQLFYAADYYRKSRKKADEKDALKALTELQGVTDAVAKSEVEEGKRRFKGLK